MLTNSIALPPRAKIRRTWARDIAFELLGYIRRRGQKHTLFVHADGEVDFMRGDCSGWDAWRDSLVGIYDHQAQLSQVIDDILALRA